MSTYLVTFVTVPALNSNHLGVYAEGRWTVWVISENEDDAVQKAYDHASAQGWELEGGMSADLVTRSQHEGDVELLICFDRAAQFGISAILDTAKVRIAATN